MTDRADLAERISLQTRSGRQLDKNRDNFERSITGWAVQRLLQARMARSKGEVTWADLAAK
jgi:hypothetical protein